MPRFQQTLTQAWRLLHTEAMVFLTNESLLYVQVLCSLPCFQQTSAKALKLLETQVHSGMTHLTVTNQTEQSASWQRLTVNFLLLLGRMADNYLLERDSFLQKLAASHRVEGESNSGAVVQGPESPALEPPNKRHRPGMVCFEHAAFQLYHLLIFSPPPAPPPPPVRPFPGALTTWAPSRVLTGS